jgi:hypothetical protein
MPRPTRPRFRLLTWVGMAYGMGRGTWDGSILLVADAGGACIIPGMGACGVIPGCMPGMGACGGIPGCMPGMGGGRKPGCMPDIGSCGMLGIVCCIVPCTLDPCCWESAVAGTPGGRCKKPPVPVVPNEGMPPTGGGG